MKTSSKDQNGSHYVRMDTGSPTDTPLLRHEEEHIFDELPSAIVIEASRFEGHEISQFQLVYTIEVHYKQVSFFS